MERPLELTAGFVGITHDEGVLAVGLAGDTQVEGWQLVLQRADEFDDQDRRLGIDTYCIVSGRQEGTVYGGVVTWAVQGNRLTLSLRPEAAHALGLAPLTYITIDRDPTAIAALTAALQDVLGNREPPR